MQPDVLLLYGSSELIFPRVPEKAADFFRTAPDRFPSFARGQRRHDELADHFAKGGRHRFGVAR
jgi:hypothetical protein